MQINSVLATLSDALQVNVNATPLSGGQAQNFQSTDMSKQPEPGGLIVDPDHRAGPALPDDGRFACDAGPDSHRRHALRHRFPTAAGVPCRRRSSSSRSSTTMSTSCSSSPGRKPTIDAANTAYAIPLPPGASVKLRLNGGATLVSSTNKTIKLTGTSGDVYWILLLGG